MPHVNIRPARAARGSQPPARAWLISCLLALAGLAAAASGQALAGEARAFGQGLLWRVETAGAPPSHVFGTMHSTDKDIVALPEPVERAFAQAGSLALELVMTPEIQLIMAQSMVLFDGRGLAQITGPERFERIVETGARYSMGPDQLRVLQPWALILMFSLPPSEVARQAAGRLALDQVLQEDAQRRGLPTIGLETIEEQIAVFTKLSELDQLSLLDSTLTSNPEIEAIYQSMKRRYLARDLDGLHRMMDELIKGTDRRLADVLDQRLIDGRNERMVETMAGSLARGNAFVAVGAMHLSGERGILRLLEKKGYDISRVY